MIAVHPKIQPMAVPHTSKFPTLRATMVEGRLVFPPRHAADRLETASLDFSQRLARPATRRVE